MRYVTRQLLYMYYNTNDYFILNINYNCSYFLGSFIFITTGMQFGWPSPHLPRLQSPKSHIPITSSEGAWMISMNGVGSIFGSLLAGYIVDKIGRKLSILITSPLYLCCWLLIAFAHRLWILMLARCINGFTDGIVFTVIPMYVSEISHPRIRGILSATIPVMTVFGLLLVNIIGSLADLKTTGLICAIFPIVHFFTFCWMPESPFYLIMKKNLEAAKNCLKIFQESSDIDEKFEKLQSIVEDEMKNSVSCWDLFRVKSNRKAVIIVFGLRGIQQLCGPNALTSYAKIIFHEAGEDISSTLSSILYFSIQLVMVIICSFLVDKVGRKPLLIISIVGSGVALLAQAIYFYVKSLGIYNMSTVSFLPLIALLTYVVLFNIGMWNIPLLLMAELFPANVRAFALCLNEIYFGLSVIVVSEFFQITSDTFGMHVPFFVFSVMSVLGLAFILCMVPETKGRSLNEIQEYLKGNQDTANN